MLHVVVPFEVTVHTGHLDLDTLDLATISVVSKETRSSTLSLLSTENMQGRVTAILDLNQISSLTFPHFVPEVVLSHSSVFHVMKKLPSNVTCDFVASDIGA